MRKGLEWSRREFLKIGTAATGVSVGLLFLGQGTLFPKAAYAGGKAFYQSSCGPSDGNPLKILVAYESYLGTTGEIAQAIGETLCELGATVDIRLIAHVDNLPQYKAVVIGSAVQRSRWMPNAVDFVQRNSQHLQNTRVAYFLSCLALAPSKSEDRKAADGRKTAMSYMEAVLKSGPEIKPVDIGLFAGVLDYSKLSFVEKMVMQSKMDKRGIAEGDYRDWQAIRSWAAGLKPHFFS